SPVMAVSVPRMLVPCIHTITYGAVPPLTCAVPVPLQTWQSLLVGVAVTVKGAGSCTVKVNVVSHPFASATVTIQEPGQRWSAVSVPWPLGGSGDQRKVYGPDPPAGVTTMLASQAPAQVTCCSCAFTAKGCGAVINTLTTVSHPLLAAIDRTSGGE